MHSLLGNNKLDGNIHRVYTTVKEFRVSTPDSDEPVSTRQHGDFDHLLTLSNARHMGHHLNILLIGEKGTGKSTACKALADILKRPFYFHGAVGDEFKLKGFEDAGGRYHETQYFKGWTQPSVIMLDEIDGSSADALLSINTDLANQYADFPTGKFDKHKDCLVVACANTNMMGATMDYTGRSTQDAALRDRFVKMEWKLDEELEKSYCGNWVHWALIIQHLRAELKKNGCSFLSPRASYMGVSVIKACLGVNTFATAWNIAVESSFWHNYSKDELEQLMVSETIIGLREQLRLVYEKLS